MIGSPVSAWIMHAFGGALGLRGWQWLFLLEGMPSAVCGLLVYWVLSDRPEDAHWLKPAERELVLADLRNDELAKPKQQSKHVSFRAWLLPTPEYSARASYLRVAFRWVIPGIFPGPTVIRQSGIVHITNVGLLAGVYSLVGIIVMVIVGRHSDRTLERLWHYTVSLLCAAAAVALLPLFPQPGSRYDSAVGHVCRPLLCSVGLLVDSSYLPAS